MKEGAERRGINELRVRDSGRKKEQGALVGDGVGSRGVSLVKPVVVPAGGEKGEGKGAEGVEGGIKITACHRVRRLKISSSGAVRFFTACILFSLRWLRCAVIRIY